MAGEIIPELIWMDHLGLRNLFENTATVQFDHRVLVFTTLGTVGGLFLSARGNPLVWHSLNPNAKLALTSLVGGNNGTSWPWHFNIDDVRSCRIGWNTKRAP